MDAIPYLDGLVKEYLLFRGFAKTVTAFHRDCKSDPGLGYQAEQLSDQLFRSLIPNHRADDLVNLLTFLRTHIFSKLDAGLVQAAADIEVCSVQCLPCSYAIEFTELLFRKAFACQQSLINFLAGCAGLGYLQMKL